jgi:integrase/recombinase XerD
MRLTEAVNNYIQYKRGLGARCNTDARNLATFCRVVGDNALVTEISRKQVEAFLAGTGCTPRSQHRKYYSLLGFQRFVISHGYIRSFPLPEKPRCKERTFVPYILSRDELRRLLDAVSRRVGRLLQHPTLRAVLLLLYGAGLRISEAVSLNLGDVDVTTAVLKVRDSKFYKTRLVPLGPQLNDVMALYANWRAAEGHPQQNTSPFFMLRSGARLNQDVVRHAFHYLRDCANVRRPDGQRPRLHDLRHSFAVHRLLSWYRRGADVQALLPALAVYLGHVRLSCTQVYLTMTPELLREASARFERYVIAEVCDE